MHNHDVELLFKMVAVGDQVELIGERTDEIARIFTPAVVETAAAVVAGDNNQ